MDLAMSKNTFSMLGSMEIEAQCVYKKIPSRLISAGGKGAIEWGSLGFREKTVRL